MRLIDADELKKTILNICGNCSNIIKEYKEGVPDGNCAIQHIMNMIDNAPTVEPFERIGAICNENCGFYRPQGEWINGKDSCAYLKFCSECGMSVQKNTEYSYNYCPNCGADMRGSEV